MVFLVKREEQRDGSGVLGAMNWSLKHKTHAPSFQLKAPSAERGTKASCPFDFTHWRIWAHTVKISQANPAFFKTERETLLCNAGEFIQKINVIWMHITTV